jgi:putative NADPH-quinone reductase
MRVLVLFAHPVETSFVTALHARIIETLNTHGQVRWPAGDPEGFLRTCLAAWRQLQARSGRGRFSPLLLHIKRLAAVCVHGASRREASLMGDPVRHLIRNNLGGVIAPDARFDYFAYYAMDSATSPSRTKFLERVARSFDGW